MNVLSLTLGTRSGAQRGCSGEGGGRWHIALQRAGVPADRVVFVGDSVWDAKASARAGVVSIGVLSGGGSRDELQNAGASCVFADPAELMAHIDRTPITGLR